MLELSRKGGESRAPSSEGQREDGFARGHWEERYYRQLEASPRVELTFLLLWCYSNGTCATIVIHNSQLPSSLTSTKSHCITDTARRKV